MIEIRHRTLRIRPLELEDIGRLELQDLQRFEVGASQAHLRTLTVPPNEAATLLCHLSGQEWQPLACAGLVYVTPARARAWAMIGRSMTKRAWGLASRTMGARLTALQDPRAAGSIARIEAETLLDWMGGHRLLRHLGFRYETHLAGAGPDGVPLALYARLRDRPANALNRLEAVRGLAFRTLLDDLNPREIRRQAA